MKNHYKPEETIHEEHVNEIASIVAARIFDSVDNTVQNSQKETRISAWKTNRM